MPLESVYVNEKPVEHNDKILIKYGDILSFALPEIEFSKYCIALKYKAEFSNKIDVTFEVTNNTDEYTAFLPKIWKDDGENFKIDKYGNEIPLEQIGLDDYVIDFVSDTRDPNQDSILFNRYNDSWVSFKNTSDNVCISEIFICKQQKSVTYSEYQKQYSDKKTENSIRIEAEQYSVKSDSFIHGSTVSNINVSPYNTYKKLINAITSSTWYEPGQKIMWEFEVDDEGWYKIMLNYSLGSEANKSSYRDIEIDGKVPFSQFKNVRLDTTGSESNYKNVVLSDSNGEAYCIYLAKGTHTLAMKNTISDLGAVYYKLQLLMEEMNDMGIQLMQLAASDDCNRTWDMDAYMPETVPRIKEIINEIQTEYNRIIEIEGTETTWANSLIYAEDQLKRLLKNPRKIPANISLLSVGDNSASKYLGTVLTKIIAQPLNLDSIVLFGQDNIALANKNTVSSAWNALKKFCYSFFPQAEQSNFGQSSSSVKTKNLNVWINKSIQYVQILQEMIDSDENLANLNIELSIMPNQQKLVLANATGTNPDVVLSVGSTTPYDFAIRNTAKNLLEYKDFLEFYNNEYNLEALIPECYNGGVYGAIETQDYQVMYYRKDILQSLGLSVPNTWDDIKRIMPALLGNSMNICLPAGNGGTKGLAVVGPYLYQNGAKVYNDDGMSTAINDSAAKVGLNEVTKIFKIYSAQKSVPSFYNSFRYGETPIGIAGSGLYLQLISTAPELTGLWDIAPTPGTLLKDGTVVRYQNADATACMIFDDTKRPNEAWQFMKWWLSSDTQQKFASQIESIYGVTYRWNTANLKAFKTLSYSQEHRNVILEQWKNQRENVGHPANYVTERELNNIWNSVVIDGKNLQEEIDNSAIQINREIIRKMEEFTYNSVNDGYRMATIKQLYEQLEKGKKDE